MEEIIQEDEDRKETLDEVEKAKLDIKIRIDLKKLKAIKRSMIKAENAFKTFTPTVKCLDRDCLVFVHPECARRT